MASSKRTVGKTTTQSPAGTGTSRVSNSGANVAPRALGGTSGQGSGGSLRVVGQRIKQAQEPKKTTGRIGTNTPTARTARIPK